ncbi:MAG: aspartate 1-decarboxylase [Proteobacteria bacterium]|nr:aspartate 1-decarboxylase [Pseudomonadota bacterium]
MRIGMLKSKIHRATVTKHVIEYNGSIGIDADLLKAANILPYEQVDVYNMTNGERFTTYAIVAPGGSGAIEVYGAAGHLAEAGHKVIICAYGFMEENEARELKPSVIFVDDRNKVKA